MSVRDYFSRDVRLRHLRLLVAIDDAGRLTRAARLLHVTQPALSKALAEIERSIGSALFERTPQGLTPTPAGATLLRAARAALAELERAGAELQRPADAGARMLLVGAMPTAGWTLLAEAVARLHATHPATTVRVSDGPTGILLPQLVAGRLDLILGARLRPAVPEGIESVPLYDDSMRLVAAPRHPLVRLRTVGWERVAPVPWVLPPGGHPTRVAFDRAVQRNGWPAPTTVVEALSADTVVAMVESLDAIALIPGRLVARLEAKGLAREIAPELADALAIPLNVTAFAAASFHADPMILALVRCLREAAQGDREARRAAR
jgi:DNA-binding transcriptional LysR family regulator